MNKQQDQIRRKINQVLQKGEKHQEDKMVSYVAKELGVKEEEVGEVLKEEIREGEIYRPDSKRIASINY